MKSRPFKLKRIPTNIPGLDQIIGNGIPRNSSTLITGYTGTGKTILALQMLYNMITNGEIGLYLTLVESKDKILGMALDFGWNDILEMLNDLRLEIHPVRVYGYDVIAILEMIRERRKENKISVLVVDSLTMMSSLCRIYTSMASKEMGDVIRKSREEGVPLLPSGESLKPEHICYAMREIEDTGVTPIYITETHKPELTGDWIAEYECDTIIRLIKHVKEGRSIRTISIEKMRRTELNNISYEFSFTKNGIIIKNEVM